jgi:DNA-binding NarL/FixJ family response regulator
MTDAAVLRDTPPTDVAQIAIVEDHGLLAQSLAYALAGRGITAVVVKDLQPDAVLDTLRGRDLTLVLLDFDLGDAGIGLDLIKPIGELGYRVAMLTGETDPVTLARCVEAGAVGVISKRDPFDRLIEHITDVFDGRGILSLATREQLMSGLRAHRSQEAERSAPFERLTVRESEVLQDLIDGKNAETIARDSFVSVATVRSHIKALLAKLGVNSQLAAVALARRSGWVLGG